MRINERRLRSIIRDMILTETPLAGDGIYRYEVSSGENEKLGMPRKIYPSIAYNQSADPAWIDEARVIMRNTPDMWAIVTLSRVNYLDGNSLISMSKDAGLISVSEDTDEFDHWLRSQNIPKGTRIIVVGSKNYQGDYENVAWAIGHDIFGHTLTSRLVGLEDIPKEGSGIALELHSFLPEIARISTYPSDLMPDIFAAIFLKIVSREYFDDFVNSISDRYRRPLVKDVLDNMFIKVDEWIASLPIDKPYLVRPW